MSVLGILLVLSLSGRERILLSHPHGYHSTDMLKEAARDFEAANPGLEVHIEGYDGEWGDYYTGLLENVTRGEGADIVTVGSTWASDFYDKGILTSLTDHMEEWRVDRARRGDIQRDFVRFLDFTYMFPGDKGMPEWHVIPMDVSTRVFFYRKDLFKKYLKRDRGPLTLKEAIEDGYYIMMKERERGNVNMSGFGVPAGGGVSGVMQVLQSFVLGNGSSFIGSGEKCTFETDDFRASLWAYTHLYEGIQSGFPGQHTFPSGSSEDLAKAFSRGELAMFAGASWLEGSIRASLEDSQLGVSLIPAGPIAPFTFQGGSGWAIPSYVPKKKRDTVWRFMQFFMEPSRGYLKLLAFGSGLVPAYESVLRSARQITGDSFGLGRIQFGLDGVVQDMSDVTVVLNDSMAVGHSLADSLMKSGADWRQVFTGEQVVVDLNLPQDVTITEYTLTTTAKADYLPPTPEHDPVEWTLYVDTDAGYQEVHTVFDATYTHPKIPLLRGADVRYSIGAPVVGRSFRFIFHRVRGTFCGDTCERIFAQIPFAVPLQYPQQGFYKMGRIEANGTLQRLVQRVHNGTSIEVATALGCAEVAVILRDPEMEEDDEESRYSTMILVVALVSSFVCVLIAVVLFFVLHKRFDAIRTEATITKLRSNNEMAEDLAKAVALMDLDEVQYLFSLDNPTRIQAAFIMIVSMMKQYRAYLPAALLVLDDRDDDTSCSISISSEVCQCRVFSMLHRKACPSHTISTTMHQHPSQRSPLSPERRVLSKDLGMRVRNATLLYVSFNLSDTSRPVDTSITHLDLILTILSERDGIVLSLRPDSVLASWNAHKVTPKHSLWAAQCALAIRNRLQTMHVIGKDGWRMALSGGKMTVAHFGNSKMKMPFVMGHAVRQVEALAELCGALNTNILATDAVVEESQRFLYVRPVEVIPVNPAQAEVPVITVWEMIGDGLPEDGPNNATQLYKDGWVAFRNNRFEEASKLFEEVVKVAPEDHQAMRMLKLCIATSLQPESFLHTADTYFRKYVGWDDLEARTSDAPLPSGVKCPERTPLTRSGETPCRRVCVVDPTLHGAEDLRQEIEKERTRTKLSKQCPRCKAELLIHEVERWKKWTCLSCDILKSGKGWKCRSCAAQRCLQCLPDEKSAAAPSFTTKEIPDGMGGIYTRSDKVLGRGAQGTVYLGMEGSGGLVAIKAVPCNKNKEVSSLLREVELLAALRHEYIVSYLSSCCMDGHIVIAMEYVSGGSLSLLLEQFGPSLNLDCVKRFVKDILHGLTFLHTQDIVHRDLKPCNVLLMADGQCKLSDFGTSATTQQIVAGTGDPRLIGTPMYMSPEACKGKSSKAVDIWALGITLFQLATGDVPYPKKKCSSVYDFLEQVSTGNLTPGIHTVSGDLKDFIGVCLLHEPDQRPSVQKLSVHPYLL